MKLTRDKALDILYENEYISDEIVGHSRWSVNHVLIFKLDDKVYRTSYSVGATEYQDERPWQYDDEVECEEVKPVEKVIIIYEPVNKNLN